MQACEVGQLPYKMAIGRLLANYYNTLQSKGCKPYAPCNSGRILFGLLKNRLTDTITGWCRLSKKLVDMAKAEALYQLGECQAAIELAERHLQLVRAIVTCGAPNVAR